MPSGQLSKPHSKHLILPLSLFVLGIALHTIPISSKNVSVDDCLPEPMHSYRLVLGQYDNYKEGGRHDDGTAMDSVCAAINLHPRTTEIKLFVL